MHPNHRFLPYCSRLDEGCVSDRKHPDDAPLAAGSAQASNTAPVPLLLDLASHALKVPVGGAVLVSSTGARTTVDPPPSGETAMIGLRCPQGTVAVAASTRCETLGPDGHRRSGVLAWSLDRLDNSWALFREQPGDGAENLSAVTGILLDAGRRALGRLTPACPSPPVWFPDGVFLHRLSRLVDRRGGRCSRRSLSWDSLSLLYPLNGSGEPLPSWLTRCVRQGFHESNTWASLRRRVVDQPDSAPAILPGLTPEVADWLDDGSFARWVLSRLSDAPSTLEWLCERVDDDLANDLKVALGEVHGPVGAAR